MHSKDECILKNSFIDVSVINVLSVHRNTIKKSEVHEKCNKLENYNARELKCRHTIYIYFCTIVLNKNFNRTPMVYKNT